MQLSLALGSRSQQTALDTVTVCRFLGAKYAALRILQTTAITANNTTFDTIAVENTENF